MNSSPPPRQIIDFNKLSPDHRQAFMVLGERLAAAEARIQALSTRMDVTGIPGADAMLAPAKTRTREPGARDPLPPVLPSQIAVPSEVPAHIATAIRTHVARDTNARNQAGLVSTSTGSYAKSTANRLAAWWLNPSRRAAAEAELVAVLPATSQLDPALDAISFDLDPAILASLAPAKATSDVLDDSELARIFG